MDVDRLNEQRHHHTYEIVIRRECAYRRGQKRGCARCGRTKRHPVHMGAPPSLNVFGSGAQHLYRQLKIAWEQRLTDALHEVGFPRCAAVWAAAHLTFPDRRSRDQGNYRFLLEKALGDALVRGGWLRDDAWYPTRQYEFGVLTARYEPGVSETRLVLTAVPLDQ